MDIAAASHALSKLDGQPIGRTRIADEAFEVLQSWILNGDLGPGSRLRINEIAEKLSTSAMPVREAIKRLEESGLVVSVPHRGAVVTTLSEAELRELYAVRRILEPAAARLAADQMQASVLADLQRLWKSFADAVSERSLQDALNSDEQFLITLYGASRNSALTALIKQIWDRIRPYKVLWFKAAFDEGSEHFARFKPALLRACRARDGQRAEKTVIDFLNDAQNELMRTVAARTTEARRS